MSMIILVWRLGKSFIQSEWSQGCIIGLVLNDNLKSKKDGGGLSVLDVCPRDHVEEEVNTNKDISGSGVHVEENS